MTIPNPSTALARILVEELALAGLTDAVIGPGSRSTALALAFVDHLGVRLHVEIDERSAGFLAVGLGKATRRPAAVVTTSGTAAANLHPAIVEAHHSRTPMLALTADRPPELRNTGANQTIDQLRLFSEVRWFVEMGVAEDRPGAARYWRSTAVRAVAEALGLSGPAGPVHLNLPFREPTVPEPDDGRFADRPFTSPLEVRPEGWVRVERARRRAEPAQVEAVAARLAGVRRGLLVLGGTAGPPAPWQALAAVLGWPIIAEPLSSARGGELVVSTAHHLLGAPGFADAHRPELIVRVGSAGLSRPVAALLASAPEILVDADGAWLDPQRSLTDLLVADPGLLAEALVGRLSAGGGADGLPLPIDNSWLDAWMEAEGVARAAVDAALDEIDRPTEPRTARDVAAVAPGMLVVGSSMAVRDLDWFMAPRAGLSVLGNRGASGIDGLVSTALGVALAAGPTVALCGDLSVLHDQNGFLLDPDGRIDCVFVVVNNDGGGIFSFLAPARQPHFERLFATPHGRSFEHLARFHRLGYRRVDQSGELAASVTGALADGGVALVEVRTDRAANVEVHRLVEERVAAALARG